MDTNGAKGPTTGLVSNEINILAPSTDGTSLLDKKAPTGSKPMIGGKKPEKPKNTFAPIEPLRPAATYGLAHSTYS